jgi:hypothetical protein
MGNDLGGYKALSAHFAIVPSAKDELARKVAWYPGLMRPAFAPRIGIGIHVVEVQPLGWKGDPMPIGSTQLTTAVDQMQQAEGADRSIGRTGRVSRFSRGMKGQGADMSEKGKIDQTQTWPAAQQIHYYLGDFGDWFVEAIKERMETGEYGPMLQELVKITPPPRRDPNNPDGQPGDGQNAADGDGAPPPPPGEGPPGGGRGGRGGRGGAGFAGGGNLPGAGAVTAGADSSQRRWSSKSEGKPKVDLSPVKQVSPCIVWLGKVDEKERDDLNKRAEALDVDILAVFSMTLHQARTGNFTNNKLLLRLYNLRTGKAVPNYSPEALINLEVEKWRQKDSKGTDPVEAEIMKMLDALDQALKPVPLPEAVTAERAKKRINDLVAKKPEEPLPVLVEARYYMVKGLLDQSDFAEAAKSLLGEDGLAKLKARASEGSQ